MTFCLLVDGFSLSMSWGQSWAKWLPLAALQRFPKLRPSPGHVGTGDGSLLLLVCFLCPLKRMLLGSKLASLLPENPSSFSETMHFRRSRWAPGCYSSPSLLQLHREFSPFGLSAFFPSPKSSASVSSKSVRALCSFGLIWPELLVPTVWYHST